MALTLAIVGGAMAVAPCIALAMVLSTRTQRDYYAVPDYCMALLWATAGSGLGIILLAAFFCAPYEWTGSRPTRNRPTSAGHLGN